MPAPESIRWTLVLWFAILGGCVGSFLNVVIYRLPRGQSLAHPGSRCPRCDHAIRWRHNLPVVSWLMLRGRCRDCGEPISARYPIVESMVAFWFAAFAWYGPLALAPAIAKTSASQTVLPPRTRWAIFGFHLVLCCATLCLTLIDWDSVRDRSVRYPRSLFWGVLLIGFAAPAVNGDLHPLRATSALASSEAGNVNIYGPFESLAGAAVGMLSGIALLPVWRLRSADRYGIGRPTAHLELVGAFVGWQAAIVVGAATALGAAAGSMAPGKDGKRVRPVRWATAAMLLAATVFALTWRRLAG